MSRLQCSERGSDVGDDTGLVIPAAGKGERLGTDVPKALLDVEGVPMIVRALGLFEPLELLDRTVVVAPPDSTDAVRAVITSHFADHNAIAVVAGGIHRQESVLNGLRALGRDTGLVVIHDAARPFTPHDVIARCIDTAREQGAAIAAVPTVDTVVNVGPDDTIAAALNRNELWAVQTPQVFSYDLILDAHERAAEEGFAATDDAALVMRTGREVHVVMGDYDNIKITVPRDLDVAGWIVRRRCCE